jgi:hypothetical protein
MAPGAGEPHNSAASSIAIEVVEDIIVLVPVLLNNDAIIASCSASSRLT